MLGRPLHRRFSLAALCAAICLATLQNAMAQEADSPRGFVDRVFKDAEGEHKYVVFVPENYTPDKKWPVILFLHGAGERGDDGRKQLDVGLAPYVKARSKSFPFVALFPQAKNRPGQSIKETWSPDSPAGKLALKILDSVEQEFSIDPKHRILTGWSMGGYGVWQQAAADPERWSAIVPVSGGGKPELTEKLGKLPVWAFHGSDDAVVAPDETQALIAALKSAGGHPRYDEISDVGHEAFKTAYGSDVLYRWMLNPNVSTNTTPLLAKPGVRTPARANENQPFRPAVVIPQAIVLRIGDDTLKAISYAIPEAVPSSLLSGGIGNIYDTTQASGYTFNVTFSGISYGGRLHRADLTTTDQGRLRLQLGMQDLQLRIGGASVRGSGKSATTGPISIVIGHRRPVWLSMQVDPYVDRGRLRLRLRSVGFQIPNDNWSVSPPAGVRTSGLGMTESRVSSGLVSGLYGKKGRIENEVRAVAPAILRRIESQLDLGKLDHLVSGFWPLPVYNPRVRLYPEQVTVDSEGISLGMGLAAAAIDPRQAPRVPRRITGAGVSPATTPQSRDLRVHVATGVLRPLTDLLIQADVARIHVADIPHDAFAPFADRNKLAEAIPDLEELPENTQIWSEFILAQPLALAGGSDNSSSTVQLELPRVVVSMAVKTDAKQAAWQPYAEFEFNLSQQADVEMVAKSFRKRYFEMAWNGQPAVKGSARFAAGYSASNSEIDTEELTQLFTQCWQNWAANGPIARRQVNDLQFGKTALRLSSAGWENQQLYMGFETPGERLTNSSDQPLVYHARGPYSGWGGPYTLPPGKSHEFSEPYPVLFRHRDGGRSRMFTLPVGTHSEYRVPIAGGAPRLFQAREPADD